MEAITVKELLAAVHGELLQGDETAKILGVNTDSRTVKAGEVFVPLVGERFDASYSAVISCFALRRRMYILTVKILQSVRGDFAKIIYPVFLQILTESDATGTVHGYG